MERGKVKHSNNGDSCFSLFEKIHFVLLSAPSRPTAPHPPRPELNSSRCLLLPGLIREWEKQDGGREREMRGEKNRVHGHNELYVEECGRNITAIQLIPGVYQLQTGSADRRDGSLTRQTEVHYGFTAVCFEWRSNAISQVICEVVWTGVISTKSMIVHSSQMYWCCYLITEVCSYQRGLTLKFLLATSQSGRLAYSRLTQPGWLYWHVALS